MTTLTEASLAGVPVCLKEGTFLAGVVTAKFSEVIYHFCGSTEDCVAALKAEDCGLFAADELALRYLAAWDESLLVTGERFGTQYITWPMSYEIEPIVSILLHRWVLAAVKNETLDLLYAKYFQKALCPLGTAGESCELPCHPVTGQSNGRGVCVCRSAKWIGSDCATEVLEDTSMIPHVLKVFGYVMFGINVATIIGCAWRLFWKRETTQVKVSQPFFLVFVLLGCLISSSTILAMAQEDDGDGPVPACMAIPWLYSVGFSITFGTLFAKIRRVYIIFKSAMQMRRNIVTFQETLGVIGAVLSVDITVLIVWTLVDPLV